MKTNEKIRGLLNKHNIELTIKYDRHGKYFDDGNYARDIYRFSIHYGARCHTDYYGQSIMHSSWEKYSDSQICDVVGRRRMTIDDINRARKAHEAKAPTEADILYSMPLQSPGNFEDFCSDFGYNSDSIKHKKIYDQVVKQWFFMEMLPCLDEIRDLLEDY